MCAEPVSELLPATTPAGYLTRLLLNETPFPGERGYVSEEDSCKTFRALILVINARIHRVPSGYSRQELTATLSTEVVDIITAGGQRGQMDGFFRDEKGGLSMAPRVTKRITRLLQISNQGERGRFARLICYAQSLATSYLDEGNVPKPDPYAAITYIPPQPVTGSAYAWMTDQEYYHPGGDFIRIPNQLRGRLGGNRFYTLRKRAPSLKQKSGASSPLISLPK